MEIIIIAAMTANGVIGAGQSLPWHLASEQRFFRFMTMGHPVIMGRKTYESIGRPLPGRTNIVLTSRKSQIHPSVHQFPSFDQALSFCRDEAEVYVIGGARVYKQALECAHTLLLTIIDHSFPGDILFPEWDTNLFVEDGSCRVLDPVPYTIKQFRRTHSSP